MLLTKRNRKKTGMSSAITTGKLMKSFKLRPLVAVFSILFTAWSGPAGRVKVAIPAEAVKEEGIVQVFDAERLPDRPFREIAYLSFDGVPGESLDALREFR